MAKLVAGTVLKSVISGVVDWMISVAAIWMIAFCFSFPFTIKFATGVWIAVGFLRMSFCRNGKNKKA